MPGNPARGLLGDYLRAVQLKQQHEQAQQAHDLAQEQLKELHEYHQTENERQQAILELNRATTAQNLKNTLYQHLGSGLQQVPENAQPTGVNVQQGVTQTPIPGNGQDIQNLPQTQTNISPTGISNTGYQYNLNENDLGGLAKYLSPAERQINVSTPEHLAEIGATAAGKKKAAEVAAEAPERESKEKIAAGSIEARIQAAQIAADQRAKSATDSASARKYAADVGADARKYAADLNANNKSKVNENELGDSATDVSMGLADLPSGANGIHVQSILHKRGEVPFGKKNGGDKLDSLNDLDGIFQDMQDASTQLGTGIGGQIVGGIKQHLPITTDLKNKISAIDARSPEVVRNVFGIGSGRITNTEINKATQALLSGTMTQDQAKENINKLRRDTYTKVYSDILGPMSTKQKVGVLSQHGGLDRWRGVEINYKGQNIPVIRKMGNGREAMFNANTGQYEGIEDLK